MLLAGFSVSSLIGVEPVWVAAVVAVVLGAAAVFTGRLHVQRVLTLNAVEFVLFVIALALVVAAAQHDGLGDAVQHLVPAGSGFAALLGIALLGAGLANVVNNLPATLILLAAIPAGAVPQLLALLVGVNIGPNLTYTGSLATLLWRREVRASGVEPKRRAFYRFAFLATPIALLLSVSALWLTLQILCPTPWSHCDVHAGPRGARGGKRPVLRERGGRRLRRTAPRPAAEGRRGARRSARR